MKKTFTKKQLGQVLIVAAVGAAVFTCAMFITNLYIDSWSFAARADKPSWVYIFLPWQDAHLSLLSSFLHLFGFGRVQTMTEFRVLASIADGLAAFGYLLVACFIWHLFRSYERKHRAVA
jgi:hypothetical protein